MDTALKKEVIATLIKAGKTSLANIVAAPGLFPGFEDEAPQAPRDPELSAFQDIGNGKTLVVKNVTYKVKTNTGLLSKPPPGAKSPEGTPFHMLIVLDESLQGATIILDDAAREVLVYPWTKKRRTTGLGFPLFKPVVRAPLSKVKVS